MPKLLRLHNEVGQLAQTVERMAGEIHEYNESLSRKLKNARLNSSKPLKKHVRPIKEIRISGPHEP